MPTLDEMKEELGKNTRALMDTKDALAKREKELADLGKRTEDAEGKLVKFAESDKLIQKLQADYVELNKSHDEVVAKLQAPGLLPGNVLGEAAEDAKAKDSYSKLLRSMRHKDPENHLSKAEREYIFTIPEARDKRSIFVSNDELGGFMVPAVVTGRMVEQLVQISPIRQFATVMGLNGSDRLKMTRENGQITAQWVHEIGSRSETTGDAWQGLEIPTHELYALVKPSLQMLEDMPTIESYIERRVARQFARAEGIAFLTGDGVGKPRGLLAHPEVEVLGASATAAQGKFLPDDVIDLMAELETEYAANARALTHRITLAAMRKFKDSNNRYLDLVERDVLSKIRAFLIDGYPASEMPNMAQWGTASAKALAFADLAEAYTVVDRLMMTIIRDPFSSKTAGLVELMFRRRVGGDVVQPAAVKILQAHA